MAQVQAYVTVKVIEAHWDGERRRIYVNGYGPSTLAKGAKDLLLSLSPGEARDLVSQLRDALVAADMADEERRHVGGNAEDCRACDSSNPPYPHICPGEGDAA